MCESLRKKQKVCNQNLLNNENFKKEDNYSKSNDIESHELIEIFINSDETQINELICLKEDIRERLKNDDEKKMVINEAKTKDIESLSQCSIYKKKMMMKHLIQHQLKIFQTHYLIHQYKTHV